MDELLAEGIAMSAAFEQVSAELVASGMTEDDSKSFRKRAVNRYLALRTPDESRQ